MANKQTTVGWLSAKERFVFLLGVVVGMMTTLGLCMLNGVRLP